MSELKYLHIYHQINKIAPIPINEWKYVEPYFKYNIYKKGDLLDRIDKIASNIHIMISGCVRLFYLTDNGKDFNHAFKFENDIFAAYASILTQTPSTFAIEALEESNILSIPYTVLKESFSRHHAWERLGRVIAESHYLTKENREYHFMVTSAEDRFRKLVLTNQNLINRVPQYHLATYLGINPSSLNRIIKKIKLEKEHQEN